MSKVSIIIPIFNGERYLRECLDSVIKQSYEELEIVLINDGSTDCTMDICQEYHKKENRIRIINKVNGGVTSARKSGLNIALGKYAVFVDADDWIPPNAIENMVHLAEKNNSDIVVCGFVEVDDNGQMKECCGSLEEGVYRLKERDDFYEKMFYHGALEQWGIWPTLWGKLFDLEKIRKSISNLDERIIYGEDAATVFEVIMDADTITVVKEPLYFYRYLNGTSVSNKKNKILLDNMFYLYEYLFDLFEKNKHKNILETQLKHYMVSLLNHAGKLLFDIPYDLQESEWIKEQLKEWQARYYDFIYSRRKIWVLPLYEINNKKRLILYGFGEVAEDFYKQLSVLSEVEVLAWYDKKDHAGRDINSIDDMNFNSEYDFVIIAEKDDKLLQDSVDYLVKIGIDKSKIIAKKPVMLEINNMQFFENEGV